MVAQIGQSIPSELRIAGLGSGREGESGGKGALGLNEARATLPSASLFPRIDPRPTKLYQSFKGLETSNSENEWKEYEPRHLFVTRIQQL